MCNFSVAVNRRRKVQGQPEADFFRVAAWGNLGKSCQQYLAKGRKVTVVGPVSVNVYTGNDGNARASMEVFAEDVEFLGGGRDGGQQAEQQEAKQAAPAASADYGTPANDEELPF